ncbi:MAG: hypothetical protein ACJAYU_002850 [Bradymonadia bacterium]|jgi:hypothetical protein
MNRLKPSIALLLAAALAFPAVSEAGRITDYDPITGQPAPSGLAPPYLVVLDAAVPGGDSPIEEIRMSSYRETDPTFASYGVSAGDAGPDAVLFETDGVQTSVRDQSNDRPTLFISVSLTCPIARASLERAAEVAALFDGAIDVKLVYVVEAHPTADPSPYTDAEWPSPENSVEGLLYQQPRTFGARVALANILIDRMGIELPVLVDGPSNAWWNAYGPAPNNAVLVAPDGTVMLEHGWFDGDGLDIVGDLIDLLPSV